MGLDTTHNCFNGAYSTFNRFRRSLAQQIGIELYDYYGYGKNGTKNLEDIGHDLMPLFNHSDCEGVLTIEECERIVNGFNQVLENFDDTIEADYDFKERIIKFRDGCLEAISKEEEVEFH